MADIGRSLKDLFRIGIKKLKELSGVNVLLIFGLMVYFTIDSVGDLFTSGAYAVAYTYSQFTSRTHIEPPITDSTPKFVYATVLLVAFMFCMWMVKKNKEKPLW